MPSPDRSKTSFPELLHWIASPLAYLRGCKSRYGEGFTMSLGPRMPSVMVFSDPRALEIILTGDSEEFEAPGDKNAILEPLLGAQSVIGLSGARHRRMRKLMIPPFHGDRMRSYGDAIDQASAGVTREWAAGTRFDVRKAMQAISMRVILRAVFGFDEGVRSRQMEMLLGSVLDLLSNPAGVCFLYFPLLRRALGPVGPWRRFLRMREKIDRLIHDEIAARRAHPDSARDDILSLLISARDEAGEPLTDAELRDELMTLLVAGHETTATALAWAFYWIHKLPAVRDRLLDELGALDAADQAGVSRLQYLSAICCETLRIYPVAMLTFPRVATSAVNIMGCSLDPGTVVVGSIYLTHHREEIYPEPGQFNPERFLDRRFSSFEYLPFGGGARRCIGMAFAQFEMKLVISRILSRFELALENGSRVRPVRRGVTAGPSPFRMVVRRGK